MKRIVGGALAGAALIVGLGLWSGIAHMQFPWTPDLDFTEVDLALTLPDEARITAVEPITLDCRARVHASIPIEGKREHSAFGRVYRTDTIEMEAIGDVDTCIEGSAAQIEYHSDGTTDITIQGEDIVFVRPRVNAVETADSVKTNKGLIGKWTDVFPWVDDDLGLTPLAYAWAQNVIGGSECMQAAYEVTESMLIDAYTQQFIDAGADPDKLRVTIEGSPIFEDPPPLELGEVEMTIDYAAIACAVSDDLSTNDAAITSSSQ